MADIHLKYINAVHMKVVAEPSILMELSDTLTFFADNYKFHPKYKSKMWDGKIRLMNMMTGYVYAGLAKRVKHFADSRDYTLDFDNKFLYTKITNEDVKDFISTLSIPEEYETREYQIDSIAKCLISGKRTLISPTSSGKSFMIYVLSRWYKQHKKLIIVPTIGLVTQMESDFREYGYKGKIHTSIGGLSKDCDIDAEMVITTWQSLNNGKTKMSKQWYQQFGMVVGDEAHGAKAKSLVDILSSLVNCTYRFGTTGTLDGNPLNETTIEGLFGPRYQAVTTKELMDQGYVSKLKIKCIVLKYPEEVCKANKKKRDDITKAFGPAQRAAKYYASEIDLITTDQSRMNYIKKLILKLDGNKLVFFRLRDHGNELTRVLEESSPNNVFYIDGGVKDRERIRKAIEDEENAILVASLGTTSTGTSIKKLHHMIAAAPQKSKTKVPQSIGRMLRLHKQKETAYLWDIVDDLSYKSYENYALQHFKERVKMYDADKFDYDIIVIQL